MLGQKAWEEHLVVLQGPSVARQWQIVRVTRAETNRGGLCLSEPRRNHEPISTRETRVRRLAAPGGLRYVEPRRRSRGHITAILDHCNNVALTRIFM